MVGQLSWPLIRPGYTPDKFDVALHRHGFDLGMCHRLALTLAARGLRLGLYLRCGACDIGGISNRVDSRYLGSWPDQTIPTESE